MVQCSGLGFFCVVKCECECECEWLLVFVSEPVTMWPLLQAADERGRFAPGVSLSRIEVSL